MKGSFSVALILRCLAVAAPCAQVIPEIVDSVHRALLAYGGPGVWPGGARPRSVVPEFCACVARTVHMGLTLNTCPVFESLAWLLGLTHGHLVLQVTVVASAGPGLLGRCQQGEALVVLQEHVSCLSGSR